MEKNQLSKGSQGYPLHQSALFKVSSKKRLAKILQASVKSLENFTETNHLYLERTEAGKKGKDRKIEEPKSRLKQIQKRISNLLHRVEKPDYLFCPAKGKSYIGNALAHAHSIEVRTLDIKAYYQSTSFKKVYQFFLNRMQCSPDIAHILTVVTTFKKHLPTGGPASPILAYYSHIQMWENIYELVSQAGCLMTVYMDDLTVSGKKIPKGLMWEIKKEVHKHKLEYHKEKRFFSKPCEVTGIMISNAKAKAPNRRHLRIHKLKQQISVEEDPEARKKLEQRLKGSIEEAKQIHSANLDQI
ncbi:MAG: reverse transcriptase family protein [Halothece sp.]